MQPAEIALPVAEIQTVEPDRVARHCPIAILLVIDRHCVPTGGTRRTGDVHGERKILQGSCCGLLRSARVGALL